MGILKDIADAAFGVSSSSQTAGKQRCHSAVSLNPHCEQAEATPPMIAEMHRVHAAAKASKYTSFLSDVSANAATAEGIEPNKFKSTGRIQSGRGHRTSFPLLVGAGPELDMWISLRNMYTSADLYSTNIAYQPRAPSLYTHVINGPFPYAAMAPMEPCTVPPHPMVRFKGMKKWIHCHMVNTETGEIFWDANYNLRMGIGSFYLSKTIPPNPKNPGIMPIMNKIWIEKSDMGPRLFDWAMNTQDNWYEDQMDTPYGDDEGWDNIHGHDAHVGVEASRHPKLEERKDMVGKPTGEVIEKGCGQMYFPEGLEKKPYITSSNPCHNDNYKRLLYREEDFLPHNFTTNDNYDLYYGWIKKRTGRTQKSPTGQKYTWMWSGAKGDYRQPQLVEMFHYVDPKMMAINQRDILALPMRAPNDPNKLPLDRFANWGQIGKPLDVFRREHHLGFNDERSFLEGPPQP